MDNLKKIEGIKYGYYVTNPYRDAKFLRKGDQFYLGVEIKQKVEFIMAEVVEWKGFVYHGSGDGSNTFLVRITKVEDGGEIDKTIESMTGEEYIEIDWQIVSNLKVGKNISDIKFGSKERFSF